MLTSLKCSLRRAVVCGSQGKGSGPGVKKQSSEQDLSRYHRKQLKGKRDECKRLNMRVIQCNFCH